MRYLVESGLHGGDSVNDAEDFVGHKIRMCKATIGLHSEQRSGDRSFGGGRRNGVTIIHSLGEVFYGGGRRGGDCGG